jgi:maltooligosyltrehalose trehalohydrolase
MRCASVMRFGAAVQGDAAVFRLWAPSARRVELLLHRPGEATGITLAGRDPDGWCEVRAEGIAAGQRYQWRIDGELVVPDPASRCNPQGPHEPSMLIDPLAFAWDEDWRGRPWHEAVFYQVHIGTWTPQGTFVAAIDRLPELAAIGITAVQLMPLADFPGEFGWGYDGVLPFAPYHAYGTPDDLKRFVQAAHRLGLMVFGDLVCNHFGPDGNYLHAYAAPFFTQRHTTAWGDAIDFSQDAVRAFHVDHALYWLHEYRFDGLRFDAVHAIVDARRPDILQEISERVRDACRGRHVHLVLENDSNDPSRLAAPDTPGRYEAQWNGDLHHTLHVLLTGEQDGYYGEYDQPLAQAARCLSRGFARQGGPHNAPQAPPRRAAEGDVPLGALVQCLQNHDQIGNRAFGERLALLADPAALRLATAIVLLMPSPPLLFMGEEYGATQPFLFFADWQGELREAVRRGRCAEFAHFARHAQAAREGRLPDPCSRETFERCKLDPAEAVAPAAVAARATISELLALRASQIVPRLQRLAARGHEASVRGTLIELRWRFVTAADDEARDPHRGPAPARWLQMQANLGAEPLSVAAPPPTAELLHGVGDFAEGPAADGAAAAEAATRLGMWSGRWHWLPCATA